MNYPYFRGLAPCMPRHLERRGALLLLGYSLFFGQTEMLGQAVVPSSADTVPPKATHATSGIGPGGVEETLVLSPFQVTAEDDRGYRAGGTLAGTRLRSELRDVPASVSVVTKDFMSDIAANDLGNILNYTLGTEVTGSSGNFSGASAQAATVDFDSIMRSPNAGTRIRGLSSADTTRDFFLSDIPLDSYITDRVEINRGANSMLFGLGSPAGVINNGIIKARTDRTVTELQNQIARFGGSRTNLDHNQILIKNKAAIRIAGLYGDRRYQQEYTFTRDERYFGTVTLRPFRNTVIRANAEFAKRDENRPQVRPPYDGFTPWWSYGKPTYDPVTNTGTMLGTPTSVTAGGVTTTVNGITATGAPNGTYLTTGLGRSNGTNMTIFYENPTSSAAGVSGLAAGTVAYEPVNERYRATTTGGMMQLREGQVFIRSINGGTTDPRQAFWRDFQLTDPKVFDFYNNTLEGPAKNEWARWATKNITLEQTLLDGMAGVEVAFDKQNLDSGFVQPLQGRTYTLYIDINTHLPNGAVNPNLGRPFISDIGWTGSQGSVRQAARATVFVDIDAMKYTKGQLGRALGRHTFTVNYTNQRLDEYNYTGRPSLTGLDYWASENATVPTGLVASTARRALGRIAYLGPSALGAATPADASIRGQATNAMNSRISSVNSLYFQSPVSGSVNNYQYRSFSVIQNPGRLVTDTTGFTSQRNRLEVESAVAVVQSRWLSGSLITTAGVRSDDYEAYNTTTPTFDPITGVIPTGFSVLQPSLNLADKQSTTFYGAVLHLPRTVQARLPLNSNLSLTYNKADNFRPTAQRFTFLGTGIEPEAGVTKEHGVLLTLFGGKFELRATNYKSSAKAANNSGLRAVISQIVAAADLQIEANGAGINDDKPAALNAWNTWMQSPTAQNFFRTFNFNIQTGANGSVSVTSDPRSNSVFATSDVTSQGWEYEAVINPTRNWRVAVNAARQEAIRTNTGAEITQFLNEAASVWGAGGSAGTLIRQVGASETIGAYHTTLVASTLKETLLDGSASPELRKWRVNLVTNYTFSEGFLRDVRVGGALRWQDKIAIGYPVINDPVAGPRYDVAAPFYGPTEVTYDAWVGYSRRIFKKYSWSMQLNVRNIGISNELRPLYTQPDGSISAYAIREPMVWTLTNTIKF